MLLLCFFCLSTLTICQSTSCKMSRTNSVKTAYSVLFLLRDNIQVIAGKSALMRREQTGSLSDVVSTCTKRCCSPSLWLQIPLEGRGTAPGPMVDPRRGLGTPGPSFDTQEHSGTCLRHQRAQLSWKGSALPLPKGSFNRMGSVGSLPKHPKKEITCSPLRCLLLLQIL